MQQVIPVWHLTALPVWHTTQIYWLSNYVAKILFKICRPRKLTIVQYLTLKSKSLSPKILHLQTFISVTSICQLLRSGREVNVSIEFFAYCSSKVI